MTRPAASPSFMPTPAFDAQARLSARSRATGALLMTLFGALWGCLGAAATDSATPIRAAVALLAVALLLPTLRAFRANPAMASPWPADIVARRRRIGRVFAWAFLGENVAIALAVNLLVKSGFAHWQAPAIMAIVGLHFLPLAAGFRYRPHWVTGIAMTAWAAGYPWLFAAGPMAPAGPLVAAAMLFASAAWALHSISRTR